MPSQMMAQPGTAGQMLAQMSRQNGVTHSVPPSSTGAPLHGGPTPGGWPGAAGGAGARPQFNNQVSQYNQIGEQVLSQRGGSSSHIYLRLNRGSSAFLQQVAPQAAKTTSPPFPRIGGFGGGSSSSFEQMPTGASPTTTSGGNYPAINVRAGLNNNGYGRFPHYR